MPTSARSVSTSKAPPPTAPTVGVRMARPYPVPATTGAPDIPYLVPGGYKIRPYNMDGGPVRSADCPGPRGWRADGGIGPCGAGRRFRHADRGCLTKRQPLCDGAGYGSRTRLCSLGSCHSTDELIPHSFYILSSPHRKCNRFLSRSGENTFPQPSPGLGAVPQASRRRGVVQQSLQKLTRWTNPRPRATLGGNV